jgi:hypothetical protein
MDRRGLINMFDIDRIEARKEHAELRSMVSVLGTFEVQVAAEFDVLDDAVTAVMEEG